MRWLAGSTLVLALLGATARADDPPVRGKPEVIILEDEAPKIVPPKPKRAKRKLPPYSDKAIEEDAWTRAWLLLDVDEHGVVTRLKVLRKPGFDLDDIAVREAFALRFEPARDAQGAPIRVQLLWGFEWPANSWLVNAVGVATAMPPDVGFPPRPAYAGIPCRGSGPMRLGSVLYKGYRDCSEPDLGQLDRLPWVSRPRK